MREPPADLERATHTRADASPLPPPEWPEADPLGLGPGMAGYSPVPLAVVGHIKARFVAGGDLAPAPLPASDLRDLAEAVRSLLAIEGVDGVGRPVTRISPWDLPPDLLGLVERLRGGAVEPDEELLLLTLPNMPVCRRDRGRNRVIHRLRLAFALLCDYAAEHGVPADMLATLFETANRPAADRPGGPDTEG